ncbi:hypothetical protein AVEN_63983-1 [Araneus ventricosus]|uniref:Uncharacterized protein n=1 Tax=Araneus ventricosus TaxID=182803 RepID=A0A4Y2NHE3_ARAVE|nr:hypothetical protein AVEN_63983-1 [Araneus ventricosus]
MSRCEAIRELFWDGLHNFKQRSPPSQNTPMRFVCDKPQATKTAGETISSLKYTDGSWVVHTYLPSSCGAGQVTSDTFAQHFPLRLERNRNRTGGMCAPPNCYQCTSGR